ncbi:putative methyltransferase, LIC12133 family [Bryocella elongata]|uniref:Putative methyltransferase, LIC12133 family n=1 Tax=Bryocella elongata TaxID=863522 RepID=A0A1H5WS02_9BACT|nr:methyltransferase, TIGR04325 family [Bryocella elongata]SEG02204.1 putative methyltransferase, LIC12133 family [Bryocella elongata]
MGAWKSLRRAQVRHTARLLLAAQKRLPGVRPLLAWAGGNRFLDEALVGYRRAFYTRAAAESRVRREGSIGHQDPRAIALHRSFEETPRPSDHDAMQQLGSVLPQVKRIVDVGGSVGNIYYLYSKHLAFPPGLEWVVCELGESVKHGRMLAAERGAANLRFEHSLDRCGPADLALFSGSLHYFDEPLPRFLAQLGSLPKYVLVNRSPMAEVEPLFAVQDAGDWFTAAKVLQRGTLLKEMSDAGYSLAAEWKCPELNVRFPLHPEHSAEHYSGLFFVHD